MMKVLLFSIVDIVCFYFVIVFYPQATTAGGSDIAIGLDADSDIRLVRIILDYFIYGTVVGDGIITLLFAKCSRQK